MPRFSNQRGPLPFHNLSQRVRAHLGLTQDDLAMLLDVSRTAVSMDEHGTRRLPPAAQGLLLLLHQALPPADAPPAADAPAPAPLTDADRADLAFWRRELDLEAHTLQLQLERGQVRQTQAQRWQQLGPALQALFPADNPEARQWLERFERRAARRVRTDDAIPARLPLRLAAIAFEIAEITKRLGDDFTS